MIERFLTDVVGVPWDDVHEEAEHLEHAMTPRFEAYVRASVGDAQTCPHGHPIRVGERIDGVPLADCEAGATVTILRLENEAEDLLHYLKHAGIEPGLKGGVVRNDGERRVVERRRRRPRVTVSVAETVSVLADPVTAAAYRAARAARARTRTLRALAPWRPRRRRRRGRVSQRPICASIGRRWLSRSKWVAPPRWE